MITVNFDVVTGCGARRRIIEPALLHNGKPVFIIAANRTVLDVNWPYFNKRNKATLTMLLNGFTNIEPGTLILVEEMSEVCWRNFNTFVLPTLHSFEIWTINRRDGCN